MNNELSKREEQILKLLLAEYSHNEICRSLSLSYSRVSDAKRFVMAKWGVNSTIGLIKEAIRRGYLELDQDTSVDQIEKRA